MARYNSENLENYIMTEIVDKPARPGLKPPQQQQQQQQQQRINSLKTVFSGSEVCPNYCNVSSFVLSPCPAAGTNKENNHGISNFQLLKLPQIFPCKCTCYLRNKCGRKAKRKSLSKPKSANCAFPDSPSSDNYTPKSSKPSTCPDSSKTKEPLIISAACECRVRKALTKTVDELNVKRIPPRHLQCFLDDNTSSNLHKILCPCPDTKKGVSPTKSQGDKYHKVPVRQTEDRSSQSISEQEDAETLTERKQKDISVYAKDSRVKQKDRFSQTLLEQVNAESSTEYAPKRVSVYTAINEKQTNENFSQSVLNQEDVQTSTQREQKDMSVYAGDDQFRAEQTKEGSCQSILQQENAQTSTKRRSTKEGSCQSILEHGDAQTSTRRRQTKEESSQSILRHTESETSTERYQKDASSYVTDNEVYLKQIKNSSCQSILQQEDAQTATKRRPTKEGSCQSILEHEDAETATERKQKDKAVFATDKELLVKQTKDCSCESRYKYDDAGTSTTGYKIKNCYAIKKRSEELQAEIMDYIDKIVDMSYRKGTKTGLAIKASCTCTSRSTCIQTIKKEVADFNCKITAKFNKVCSPQPTRQTKTCQFVASEQHDKATGVCSCICITESKRTQTFEEEDGNINCTCRSFQKCCFVGYQNEIARLQMIIDKPCPRVCLCRYGNIMNKLQAIRNRLQRGTMISCKCTV